jgi:hypothetical protein
MILVLAILAMETMEEIGDYAWILHRVEDTFPWSIEIR